MRKLLFSLVLILTSITLWAQNEEEAVLNCFNTYKNALLNDEGEKAADIVDAKTIKYYADILVKVIRADSLEIEAMNLMDKFMVLTIRHREEEGPIKNFSGYSLFKYAVEEGMVGKNSVAGMSIGNIQVEGDYAKGQMMKGDQALPAYYSFYKESGVWKLNLTETFEMANKAFEMMAENSGMGENEFIMQVLEVLTGEQAGPEIWQPLGG